MSPFKKNNNLYNMWLLIRGVRFKYLASFFSQCICTIANVWMFLLLKNFIDNILGKPDKSSSIIQVAIGIAGLAIFQALFSFLSRYLSILVSEYVARHLRNDLFSHIQKITIREYDNLKTGDLLQRSSSDIESIRRLISDHAFELGRILIIFVINVYAIFNLNILLGVVSVTGIPFIFITSRYFMKKISEKYRDVQILESKLTVKLQENLSNIRTIKALSKHEYEEEVFTNINREQLKIKKRHIVFYAMYRVVSMVLAWSFRLGGYIVGVILAINGQITLGTYIAFVGIISNVIWPMRQLNAILIEYASSLVSLSRITEIFFKSCEIYKTVDHSLNTRIKGEIVFKDVCFSYNKKINTLKGINLKCEPDTVIALIGTTGSGKTSLINLLPRFYDYTKGSILLDGLELKKYPLEILRSTIGIVEQEPFLFSCSVAENIALGIQDKEINKKIISAAKTSYIYDEIISLPDGFDTIVGENGIKLSGGQRQRVAIARVLLKNPKILILDDAMSSVDVENEQKIRMAMKNLMRDRTTFIIAHRIKSILLANIIVVLNNGIIEEIGSHSDLIKKNGIYAKMYNLQATQSASIHREMSNGETKN